MRIVAVADTHLFERDLPPLPRGDVLVHAGDLCRRGDLEELERAAAWLRALPYRHKIVVAGNHDWAFARQPAEARALLGPGVCYLEDRETSIDGLRFWGSPWQPAFGDWAFNLPRGAPLAEKWALIPAGIDVLVTHAPPEGQGDRTSMAGRLGCRDLRERVAALQPRLHLFGHIHEDGGAWEEKGTLFVNATTWECARGATVVELKGKRRRARAVEVPPAWPFDERPR
jgi:Icc-related predicted phosphoesterase